MDNEKIAFELAKPLALSHIKSRSKGGTSLSYIEGWRCIEEANRIFGFDGWDMETVYCKEVCRELNEKNNHIIGYEAKVRVTVKALGCFRDGTGYGSGIAKGLYDAYEGAGKEAETDAMKRAFMKFGNPFGLALYDKDRAGVEQEKKPSKLDAACRWYEGKLSAASTKEEIAAINETEKVKEFLAAAVSEEDIYSRANIALSNAMVRIG